MVKIDQLTPPHSLVAEMALLGALLLADDEPLHAEVAAGLPGPEVFFAHKHGLIYAALCRVMARERKINLVLLHHELTPHIEEIGGGKYLEQLVTETPGPAAAMHYARIIVEQHRLRTLIAVAGNLAQAASAQNGEASEIAARAAEQIGKAVAAVNSGVVKIGEASSQVVEALVAAKPAYLPSPWEEFDSEFGGLAQGCVNTVMGTPSSGKTTLCLQLILHLAGQGIGTMIFSNEQGPRRVAATMLTMESGVPVHDRWGRGTATVDEIRSVQQASERLASLPIEQVSASLNAEQIVQQARFAKQRGFRVAFVDYLQQIPALKGCNTDRERIAESMKMLARIRDLDMTLILVSQIDKSTSKGTAIPGDSKRRPTMFDGLGAAEIEQASDWMYSVFRPHQHETPGVDIEDWRERQSVTEFGVLKAKFGARGVFALRFHPQRMEFSR